MKFNTALDLLKSDVQDLWQPTVLLNVLRNRTELEHLEDCEMRALLALAEQSIESKINSITERLETLEQQIATPFKPNAKAKLGNLDKQLLRGNV